MEAPTHLPLTSYESTRLKPKKSVALRCTQSLSHGYMQYISTMYIWHHPQGRRLTSMVPIFSLPCRAWSRQMGPKNYNLAKQPKSGTGGVYFRLT